jgi:Flp pilus assembly protein TadB
MNKVLIGLAAVWMAAAPVLAEKQEFDIEQAMEHLEFENTRQELVFEQDMRELELEERRLEMEMMRRKLQQPQKHPGKDEGKGAFLLICGIVHLLMAIWVYQDIRRKNNGNGIWIVITLLAGFFGASVYALIRIADGKSGSNE